MFGEIAFLARAAALMKWLVRVVDVLLLLPAVAFFGVLVNFINWAAKQIDLPGPIMVPLILASFGAAGCTAYAFYRALSWGTFKLLPLRRDGTDMPNSWD
ncbi:MAG: hypothetical protein H0T51_00885 [Pirellulales bacterium]|nr:hypothetical protein [Pirellulales bacterium]